MAENEAVLFEIGTETQTAAAIEAATTKRMGQTSHMQGPRAAAHDMFNKRTEAFSFSNTADVGSAALALATAIAAGVLKNRALEGKLRMALAHYNPQWRPLSRRFSGDGYSCNSSLRPHALALLTSVNIRMHMSAHVSEHTYAYCCGYQSLCSS